ncbi:amidohydrolase [Oceanirhabdus seepicola]|uniref:Peptidase M20 domain-containing protein 2 n=1 Tax=Oceanirhabdus seepicola TaxID=2828781 RepID=A0A9J6P6H6_9CLOT|nr:amidohydrolase [Oceanirhabdus seepicola]MCM1992187.1 amidohydrolase [Oceanirhabdus seepicola]
MEIKKIKESAYDAVDRIKNYIEAIGESVYGMPESGFKEFNTSELVKKEFEKMGLKCVTLGNIPGVKATIDTGKEGPGVAVIGELDGVICSQHKDSDNETGVVHACGHNIMIADMLGVAKVMMESMVYDELVGKIHFIAAPAEEYLEMDFRSELMEKGIIKYPTGKAELIHRGVFDDVDICVMIHALEGTHKVILESGSNGFIAKKTKYIGKASHAASAPDKGVNALYAANLGLMAINSIRETFKEESALRVHPMITKGGDAVNVIPAEVTLETFVRGSNIHDVVEANYKVNRAIVGGAVAMGAKVEIEDTPGMFPLVVDERLRNVAKEVGIELVGEDAVTTVPPSKGSTDLGDVSSIMPVIETCIGCISGGLHSPDYIVSNKETAYVTGTKFLTGMVIELLSNNSKKAKEIIKGYKPVFNYKHEYFAYADKLFLKDVYPKCDCMTDK